MSEPLDIIVVGAGPTGLACGIEAARAGLSFLIVEKGCLVNSLFSYPANMTFFTSRELLEIGDLPLPSINVKPTRAEALEYYRRVAESHRLPVRYHERVITIRKTPIGTGSMREESFVVKTEGPTGKEQAYAARNVIIATGYYDLPNRLGIPGEDLPKVSHYAREGHEYFRQRVAVIGGANSAAVTALDLYRHGAEVTLIYRGRELSRHIKYWIKPDLENRIKAKSIRAMFESEVKEIGQDWISVQTAAGETVRIENDFVFALVGYHPDVDLLRSAGIKVDPQSYRPELNPDTLESNVPGLYVAGVVVSGLQTNEIFIENGRFHGKQIIGAIKRKM
ncbi:MAG: YpdA family putative bacillithiol disulfide reductase [Terriglobia bacterium]